MKASTLSPANRRDIGKLTHQAHRVFGIDALRPGQREVIGEILRGGSVLAIMPTGAGKSLCYQLPSLALPGVTLVISPLLALMKDQADKLQGLGLNASEINSSLSARDRAGNLEQLEQGKTDFLFATPEQLSNSDFMSLLKASGISLVVIDEAHCISRWGHDFRPAYLELAVALKELGNPPVLALTATATEEVISDIADQLAPAKFITVNLGVYRDNLLYEVFAETSDADKQSRANQLLRELDGAGLIYCATIKSVEAVFAYLSERGHQVLRYHGKMRARDREETQDRFMAGKLKAVVATNAFGMGIDKPDLRFVIHYDFPGSIESYYQESGRAGRDGELARCVLCFRLEDRRVQTFFLSGRYPRREDLLKICEAIPRVNDTAAPAIARRLRDETGVSLSRSKVILSILKSAGIVHQKRAQPLRLVAHDLQDLSARIADEYQDKHNLDLQKLEDMMQYGEIATCRWKYIVNYFGEEVTWQRCDNCDNCLRSPEARIGNSDQKLL